MDTPETEIEQAPDTSMAAAFMEAAQQADRGEDIASVLPDKPAQVETEENVPTAEELADPKNKDRARDPISGKFIKGKTDDIQQQLDKVAAPEVPATQSEFEKKKQEKAQKDQERLNRTWENVNKEKDELARRRQELAQYEQQLQQPRQPIQKREFTSKEMFEAAQDYKNRAKQALDAGDYDGFNENNSLAEQAIEHGGQFYQLEQQEAQQYQMHRWNETWKGHLQKAFDAEPELAKADSSLSQQVQALLQSHGNLFWQIPDGFPKLVEVAKLRRDANDAPSLREANKKLQAEVDRLNGLTSPSRGGVTAATSPQSFDSKSPDEQFKSIMRGAAAFDSGE